MIMIAKALDRRSGEPRLWEEKNQFEKTLFQLKLIRKALMDNTIRLSLKGAVMIIVISVCFLVGFLLSPILAILRHSPKAQ